MHSTCPDSFTDPFICGCRDGFEMTGFRTQRPSERRCLLTDIKQLLVSGYRLTSFHPRSWLLLATVSSSSSFSSFVVGEESFVFRLTDMTLATSQSIPTVQTTEAQERV